MKKKPAKLDPPVLIRRAKPRDFLAIAALDRVAWKRNRHGAFIPDGEHVWRIWCEYALMYVAVRGERLAGAILAFPCHNGRYCLHKVMVAEECRGRGVAGKLMTKILRHMDRIGADMFLTVDPANESALRLYRNRGFTQHRLVRGFYRAREDRYVLTRRRTVVGKSSCEKVTTPVVRSQHHATT